MFIYRTRGVFNKNLLLCSFVSIFCSVTESFLLKGCKIYLLKFMEFLNFLMGVGVVGLVPVRLIPGSRFRAGGG